MFFSVAKITVEQAPVGLFVPEKTKTQQPVRVWSVRCVQVYFTMGVRTVTEEAARCGGGLTATWFLGQTRTLCRKNTTNSKQNEVIVVRFNYHPHPQSPESTMHRVKCSVQKQT